MIRTLAAAALAAATLVLIAGCSGRSGPSAPAASSVAAPIATASAPLATPALAASSSLTAPAPLYGSRRCWPIVLVHGSPGSAQFGPIDYFFGVPGALSAQGFEVFTPDFQGADIASRARSLAALIAAKYPDPRTKVNLIAHSAGGLDARCAISQLGLGARVASLTTIAAPHRGCAVNDLSVALFPNVPSWLDTVLSLVGFDRTQEFTTSSVVGSFNPQNPDDPRVAYFSFAGVTDAKDVTPCFLISLGILDATEGPNDGVVSVASAKWGTFEGTLATDHLGEVGQLLGFTAQGFDQVKFFEGWAAELERRGFGP